MLQCTLGVRVGSKPVILEGSKCRRPVLPLKSRPSRDVRGLRNSSRIGEVCSRSIPILWATRPTTYVRQAVANNHRNAEAKHAEKRDSCRHAIPARQRGVFLNGCGDLVFSDFGVADPGEHSPRHPDYLVSLRSAECRPVLPEIAKHRRSAFRRLLAQSVGTQRTSERSAIRLTIRPSQHSTCSS
jgi:hypothetical protein